MKKIFIVIALLFSLTLTSVNAVEVTVEEKITGLYVAYFNRAADQAGLEYWKNTADNVAKQGGDVSSVFKTLSGGFATHPTFTSTYAHLSDKEFVEAIYRNSLGRDGDTQGIAYWTDLLDRGMIRSDMVATFVELSMVTDLTPANYPTLSAEELAAAQLRQDLITNKVTVALKFTRQLGTLSNVVDNQNPEQDPAYIASVKIISEVTEDQVTVTSKLGFLEEIKESDDPIVLINTSVPDVINRVDRYFFISDIGFDFYKDFFIVDAGTGYAKIKIGENIFFTELKEHKQYFAYDSVEAPINRDMLKSDNMLIEFFAGGTLLYLDNNIHASKMLEKSFNHFYKPHHPFDFSISKNLVEKIEVCFDIIDAPSKNYHEYFLRTKEGLYAKSSFSDLISIGKNRYCFEPLNYVTSVPYNFDIYVRDTRSCNPAPEYANYGTKLGGFSLLSDIDINNNKIILNNNYDPSTKIYTFDWTPVNNILEYEIHFSLTEDMNNSVIYRKLGINHLSTILSFDKLNESYYVQIIAEQNLDDINYTQKSNIINISPVPYTKTSSSFLTIESVRDESTGITFKRTFKEHFVPVEKTCWDQSYDSSSYDYINNYFSNIYSDYEGFMSVKRQPSSSADFLSQLNTTFTYPSFTIQDDYSLKSIFSDAAYPKMGAYNPILSGRVFLFHVLRPHDIKWSPSGYEIIKIHDFYSKLTLANGDSLKDDNLDGIADELYLIEDDDGDDIRNFADLCPNTSHDLSKHTLLNGCYEDEMDDTDGDGYMDGADSCPYTKFHNAATDVDGNGCAAYQLHDIDNDGVEDAFDKCPDDQARSFIAVDYTSNYGCSVEKWNITWSDDDNDGVVIKDDICPNTPESERLDVDLKGCSSSEYLDDDTDGTANSIDICPNTPSTYISLVNSLNGCYPPEILDDDNDGVVNLYDNCPSTIISNSYDSDGCNVDEYDDDNDNIINRFDECPNTLPENVNFVSSRGCVLKTLSFNDTIAASCTSSGLNWVQLNDVSGYEFVYYTKGYVYDSTIGRSLVNIPTEYILNSSYSYYSVPWGNVYTGLQVRAYSTNASGTTYSRWGGFCSVDRRYPVTPNVTADELDDDDNNNYTSSNTTTKSYSNLNDCIKLIVKRGTSCGKEDSVTINWSNGCDIVLDVKFALERDTGFWQGFVSSNIKYNEGSSGTYICHGTGNFKLWAVEAPGWNFPPESYNLND